MNLSESKHFSVFCNNDLNFKPLNEVSLLNSVCFFEHRSPMSFKYDSPISIRFIQNGNISYKGDYSYTNIRANKFFFLLERKMFETIIDKSEHVKGLSVFFDEELINECLLIKLKGHDYLLENHSGRSDLFLSELLVPKSDDLICKKLSQALKLMERGINYRNGFDQLFYEILMLFINFSIESYRKSEELVLKKDSSKKEIIRRLHLAKCYIHDNYHLNIRLDEISQASYLSKYCFQRYFKSYFNISPTEYLMRVRLGKAFEQLKNGKSPISLIASSCGFNSSQYFSYSFKNQFGSSPSNIRHLA